MTAWWWLAVALALLATPRAGVAAPMLTIEPASTVVNQGDAFVLDVVAADMSDLFEYQLDITFDPLLLNVDLVTEGGFLTSGGGASVFGGVFALSVDNVGGTVTLLDALLGPLPVVGASGSGVLATLSFVAVGAGVSAIGLSNVILADVPGAAIDAALVPGEVTILPREVPEPGVGLLLATACAGLWRSLDRRRRSN